MKFLCLSETNIQDQHICCAIRDENALMVTIKKAWLKTQFKNGYRFHKGDVRGKVFIEYGPIKHSWRPLSGKGLMVINYFWVSARFKQQETEELY